MTLARSTHRSSILARTTALLLGSLAAAPAALAQLQPQAIYPLTTDLFDTTNINGPMTLFGTPLPNPPANGLCFNGLYLFGTTPGQDARTPLIPTLNTTDFQFSVEFSITSLGPFNRPVVMGGHLWRFLGIYVQPNGLVGIKHNNSNYAWSPSTTLITGMWYSATVKYENGTAELYINGVQALQANVGVLSTSTNLNFCTNDYSNGTAFHGCIRNLQIANDTTLGISAGAFPYGSGCDGLTLGSNGAPALGNLAFALVAGDVPVTSPVAFFGFGFGAEIPGVDLTPLGMAGCQRFTNLDQGIFGPAIVVGTSASFLLPIPPNPAYTGLVLTSQAVAFSAATTAGLASSNGVQLVIAP